MQVTPTQEQVIKAIRAARKPTTENGVRTTYAQNQILQKLSPEDLAAVALALEE
jgi:hypothetical protein